MGVYLVIQIRTRRYTPAYHWPCYYMHHHLSRSIEHFIWCSSLNIMPIMYTSCWDWKRRCWQGLWLWRVAWSVERIQSLVLYLAWPAVRRTSLSPSLPSYPSLRACPNKAKEKNNPISTASIHGFPLATVRAGSIRSTYKEPENSREGGVVLVQKVDQGPPRSSVGGQSLQ